MGKKSQALIKRMKQARGYLYPEWELGATRKEVLGAFEATIVPGGEA